MLSPAAGGTFEQRRPPPAPWGPACSAADWGKRSSSEEVCWSATLQNSMPALWPPPWCGNSLEKRGLGWILIREASRKCRIKPRPSTLPVSVCCTSAIGSFPGGSSNPILTSTQARFTSKQQNFGGPTSSHPYKSSRQALRTRIGPICLGVILACNMGLSTPHTRPITPLSSSLSTDTPTGGRNCANWAHMSSLVWSVAWQKSLESLTRRDESSAGCLLHTLSLVLPDRRQPSNASPFSWLKVWSCLTAWHKAGMAPRLTSWSGPLGNAHTAVRTW